MNYKKYMNSIFTFQNYKDFLKRKLKSTKGLVTGYQSQLAEAAGIQSSNLSNILNHEKSQLNLDQAILMAEFMGLSDLETEYFLNLVSLARAQSQPLKKRLTEKLLSTRKTVSKFESKYQSKDQFSDSDRAIYYSNWYYQAIHIVSGIEGFQELESLIARLGIPQKRAVEARDFLLKTGLCTQNKGLRPSVGNTRLDPDSPFMANHLRNWREQAIQRQARMNPAHEISYSGNYSLSKKDAEIVRKRCAQFIEELRERVTPSKSEEAYFLNLDWIKI